MAKMRAHVRISKIKHFFLVTTIYVCTSMSVCMSVCLSVCLSVKVKHIFCGLQDMEAKPATLGTDMRAATRAIMSGQKDLPEVKVCTCTQYQLFSAILVLYRPESARLNVN